MLEEITTETICINVYILVGHTTLTILTYIFAGIKMRVWAIFWFTLGLVRCLDLGRTAAGQDRSAHGSQLKDNYTEEEAKVVAAIWGSESIQFLATLAILH